MGIFSRNFGCTSCMCVCVCVWWGRMGGCVDVRVLACMDVVVFWLIPVFFMNIYKSYKTCELCVEVLL